MARRFARPSNARPALKSRCAALVMRTILLELERICNHVADIGAIATDVGFVIANAHASRLKEMMVTLNEQLTGSRLLRGMVCVGGVRRGWDHAATGHVARSTVDSFAREFQDLIGLIDSSESTRDRLEQTGILRPDKARDLGIVGVGGRASGVDLDVRRDHPYAAYRSLSVPCSGLPGRRRLAPDAGSHRRSEGIDWHHPKSHGA